MSRFLTMAGQGVAELADQSAEAGRLSRGRALFRKGSVSDLSVVEGSVIASVRGSQGDEYETTVGSAPAPPGVARQVAEAADPESGRNIDDLIGEGVQVCPREMDLAFGCDCADWDEPCKHVVAVLLAFADRVDLDETELLRWRGLEFSESGNDESGNDESGNDEPGGAVLSPPAQPVKPSDRTTRLSELESLLGDTVLRVPQLQPGGADLQPGGSGSQPEGSGLQPEGSGLQPEGSGSQPGGLTLAPALAEFLGVDMVLEPLDVSGIVAAAPLFVEVQLGPLADLGPELAGAIALIIDRLDDDSPG